MTDTFKALVDSGGPITIKQYYEELLICARDGTFPATTYGACRYRIDKQASCPCRCAVGILIPDAHYHPRMEGEFLRIVMPHAIVPEGMTKEELNEVQKAHDDISRAWDLDKFAAKLKELWFFKEAATCS